MPPAHIAVLGGGLTGLASAFYLSKRFPSTLITVLEKSCRTGGWVNSQRVELSNGTSVLLESGPRTLRPNAKSLLELINLLNLKSSLVTTPKVAPAAKNRYVSLPGRPGLRQIPNSIPTLIRSPLTRIMVPPILCEPFKSPNRPEDIEDESVDSFLTRRFGAWFAETFGSAMVHGIYAGDSRKLSVRAAFPSIWEAENRGGGSLVKGMLKAKVLDDSNSYDVGSVEKSLEGVSVFSFKEGTSTVTNAIANHLRMQPNVKLDTGVSIEAIRPGSLQFTIETSRGVNISPTHVVSTLSLPCLQSLIPKLSPLPHLTVNPYSTVILINLVFAKPPIGLRLHPPGFGYLVPRPPENFFYLNPGILGVVFDSEALSSQDIGPEAVVKMTVMLGGPHTLKPSDIAVQGVLKHVAQQMGHKEGDLVTQLLMSPLYYKVHRQQECIPTLTVGHLKRMEELRGALQQDPWQGRMEVIGAGVGGVSFGDCVEAGRKVGLSW